MYLFCSYSDAQSPTEDNSSSTRHGVGSSFGGLGFGGFTSLMSGVSEALETAGSKVREFLCQGHLRQRGAK